MPAYHCIRRHHFRIKPRLPRKLAMQKPAMPIRPGHHWSDTKSIWLDLQEKLQEKNRFGAEMLSYHIGCGLPKAGLWEVLRERLAGFPCQRATDQAACNARFDFKRQ
jgi:hypothetical protein